MSHSILRIQRIKSYSDTTGIQKHVQRETEKTTNQDIDRERSHLNYDFINDANIDYNENVKHRIENGYTGKQKVRKDAIRLVDGIITSDSAFFDKMSHLETEYFFEHALNFIKDQYGEENIMYATVHLDEKTPHMHFGFVPLTEDGRLSAKDVIGNKKALSVLQDNFNDFVKEKGYDMQRGESSIISERKHLDVGEYKEETDFHKKELERVKSDLKHEFAVLDDLVSNSSEQNVNKLENKELPLPEANKLDLGMWNRVKNMEQLDKLYKTIDSLFEIIEEQRATIKDKDNHINDSQVAYDKLKKVLEQQKDLEALRMDELNINWEKDYKKIKEKHENLTHVLERKAYEVAEERTGELINNLNEKIDRLETDLSHAKDEKEVQISKAVMTEKDKYSVLEAKHKDLKDNFKSAAEKLADEKLVEMRSNYTDLKQENQRLNTDLSDVKAEKDDLITENKDLKSTVSELKERYQEMKTGFEKMIDNYQIKLQSAYYTTKTYIKTLVPKQFERALNHFRVDYDDDLMEYFDVPDDDLNDFEKNLQADESEDVEDIELDLEEVKKSVYRDKRMENSNELDI